MPCTRRIFSLTRLQTVEDLYEALVQSGTAAKFGIAFCEASGDPNGTPMAGEGPGVCLGCACCAQLNLSDSAIYCAFVLFPGKGLGQAVADGQDTSMGVTLTLVLWRDSFRMQEKAESVLRPWPQAPVLPALPVW